MPPQCAYRQLIQPIFHTTCVRTCVQNYTRNHTITKLPSYVPNGSERTHIGSLRSFHLDHYDSPISEFYHHINLLTISGSIVEHIKSL